MLLSILSCLVLSVHAPKAGEHGDQLGIAPPFFDTETGHLLSVVIFAVQVLILILFINIPKKSLWVFQGQASVFEGVYLALDQLLKHYLQKIRGIYWFILLIGALIAAILSYDLRFRQLYLSGVAAFILSYYATLVLRISLYLYFLGLFGVLYVVLFVLALQNDLIVFALSKAALTSYGLMAFVDSWGPALFTWMHGLEGPTKMWLGFLLGGLIIIPSFAGSLYLSYNADWAEEKAEELKREVV
jgi:hypothetical protein